MFPVIGHKIKKCKSTIIGNMMYLCFPRAVIFNICSHTAQHILITLQEFSAVETEIISVASDIFKFRCIHFSFIYLLRAGGFTVNLRPLQYRIPPD